MTRWQPASPSWASCEQLAHGQRAVRAAQQLAQRGAGDEGLEAAAVAAAADRALGIDQDVADLARDAARAAEGAAVDHEAGADARRQAQVGHHVGAAADAEGRLAQRADVGVVVEVDGQPEALLHLRGRVEPDPAGQDRLRVHAAALAVDRAGQAHARGEDAAALDARLLDQLGRPAWRRCRGRPRRRCRPRAPRRTRPGSSRRGRRRRRAGSRGRSRGPPRRRPSGRGRPAPAGGRPARRSRPRRRSRAR